MVRIFDAVTGEDITNRHNIECLGGATLRRALQSLGLPVSGTKRQQARRLDEWGYTAAQIKDQYGYRETKD